MRRAVEARRLVGAMRRKSVAARVIQSMARGAAARTQYRKDRASVVAVQMAVRRFVIHVRCSRATSTRIAAEAAEKAARTAAEEARIVAEAAEKAAHEREVCAAKERAADERERAERQIATMEAEARLKGLIDPDTAKAWVDAATAAAAAPVVSLRAENASLRVALERETLLRTEYAQRMVASEAEWSEQMAALRVTLHAARKAMEEGGEGGHHVERSAATSTATTTTAAKLLAPDGSLAPLGRVGELKEEFDARSRVFDDDADFIVEVKEGVSAADLDPEFELHSLQNRFDSWKHDFKDRIKTTKATLKKLDKAELAVTRAEQSSGAGAGGGAAGADKKSSLGLKKMFSSLMGSTK